MKVKIYIYENVFKRLKGTNKLPDTVNPYYSDMIITFSILLIIYSEYGDVLRKLYLKSNSCEIKDFYSDVCNYVYLSNTALLFTALCGAECAVFSTAQDRHDFAHHQILLWQSGRMQEN